ncbi:MAG: lasso peptide biosynthesis B2 protein [Gaiellales bacterium]
MSTDLAAAGMAIAADNMWKLSLLGRVLERAERAQVPVVVLKGAAFLGWLYRLDERQMADVDLLIHPSDRGRFVDAIRPYGRVIERRGDVGVLPAYERGQFSVDFKGLALDIHVHILDSPWLRQLVPIDERGIWARASRAEVADRRALRLSVEDQLLHLAAHSTFHHSDWSSDHPHRINDAMRILRGSSVDWDLLCGLAQKQGLRTAAWLLLSSPALSSLVPLQVLLFLRPGRLGTARIRVAARLARTGDRSLGPILLTDRNFGLLRALASILTPSPDWLRRHYVNTPTTPGRAARHYLRIGAYGTERVRRLLLRGPGSVAKRRSRLNVRAKVSLAVRIWFWFLVVHLELRRHPLPRVIARLKTANESRAAIAPRTLGEIVVRALRVGRYQPRCLISTLVLYRLLAEQGDRGEVVIGLEAEARSKDAHAWIEIGGADVGPPPGRGPHMALARYS